MHKIMIVDNEMIEREALCILIQKNFKHKIEIIAEAKNGQDAVEMAIDQKPDIILMDIQMPLMNGLDASLIIKEHLESTEIIILTAFDYFEYAKKAIELQVTQYLLKPISEEKLMDILSKTIKKIEINHQVKQQNIRSLEQLETLKPLIHKKIIKELINEELKLNEYIEYIKLLNFNNSQFICIIIEEQDNKPFDKYIQTTIQKKLKFVFGKMIYEYYLNRMVFLFYLKPNNIGNFEYIIENVVRDIKEYVTKTMKTIINVGVSKLHDSYEEIYCVYKEANQSLFNHKYITGKIHANKLKAYPVQSEINVYDYIIHGDLNNVYKEFDEILAYLTQVNDIKFSILSMKQFCFMLHRNLLIHYGSLSIQADINKMLRDLECCRDILEIKEYMHLYFKKVIKEIKLFSNSKTDQIILSAKEYIQENFHSQSFSLNEVADALQVSPYYLSRLFKKSTNSNFKDYLIKVRMEKAKQLLCEGMLPIKEISYSIGYEDPNYFSRAFKKYEGIPATLYARKVSK